MRRTVQLLKTKQHHHRAIQLHHEWIGSPPNISSSDNSKQSKVIIFLHGLLGNGRNLATLARQLVKRSTSAHDESSSSSHGIAALLLDLRGHGKSPVPTSSLNYKSTLELCAQDIRYTLQRLNLVEEASPIGCIGHSFGGRVALEYTHSFIIPSSSSSSSSDDNKSSSLKPPRRTWILDSVPGAGHESVANVIRAVSEVPMPIANKKALVQYLTQRSGIDLIIANWMTTNLKKSSVSGDGGYDFTFQMKVIMDILNDFPSQPYFDMLYTLKNHGRGVLYRSDLPVTVDIVRAGKNKAWSDGGVLVELNKLTTATSDNELKNTEIIKSHTLEKADHWVHVDDLEGLLTLLEPSFLGKEHL